uniref:Uncharacterized protein n=1 Tax=Picea glauca TaxID=3330 RepID=A0A117NI96_PICGL|nr:hypothetical protein ABT39_MTgene2850 [Picea glauca]
MNKINRAGHLCPMNASTLLSRKAGQITLPYLCPMNALGRQANERFYRPNERYKAGL